MCGIDPVVDPILLQCFATWLFNSRLSPATIRTYVAAVKFWAQLTTGSDIVHTFALTKTLRGIARAVPQVPDERQPLTGPYLAAAVESLSQFLPDYYHKLYAAMFSVAFYAMLRVSEMTKTRYADHNLPAWALIVHPNAVTLRLQSSKTSHSTQPEQLVTIHQQLLACPIAAISQYLSVRGDGYYLFVHPTGDPITYDQFAAVFATACFNTGLPFRKLTTHSFRIGGATFYSNAGYTEAQVKLLGRWSSDSYKRYIRSFQ
jgi:integrase